jgi:hypothetical protein
LDSVSIRSLRDGDGVNAAEERTPTAAANHALGDSVIFCAPRDSEIW